ncbi:hypothetical protein KQI82_00785 [Oscillibacter sp. MSJ-2]|uniref:Uncharacterized protein n=1 Tax=Dysosmobacter acutus TaxID=2841504 RepID=A0ABS6F599_9FIRM|nr:hypothetical protein [Dysosmobacter acutus]MBU5625469.1 hypothetical protein [Dysosmobacter acutus]
MLYPVQMICERQISIATAAGADGPPAQFLEIGRILSRLFDECPTVVRFPGSTALTLLYRNAVYLWQDVLDCTDALAAALCAQCPLRFYGTTEGRESAEWTVCAEGRDSALVRLRSPSGRPFDHLQGLAVQMEMENGDSAAALAEVCLARPFRVPCAALTPKGAALLEGSSLLARPEGGRFSYLSWERLFPRQLLFALTAAHKALLWREFLENGRQSAEFDWLWESYYTQEPLYLLEWEVALRMVLENLGFRVERSVANFHITDSRGRERRFDLIRGGPAEKLFLKLIFPIDTK